MLPIWIICLVIGAALYSVCGLISTVRGALRFKQRSRFAPLAGNEPLGVRYALFAGMMPWAKESARKHLPTYFAGITYHAGIAAGFLVLTGALLTYEFKGAVKILLLCATLIGATAGIGLLLKRAFTFSLRAISTPDDVISSSLTTLFLTAAAATVYAPKFSSVLAVIAIILFMYIPLGKIRHCFLFFFSRVTFGRFFGRRGVLPHQVPDIKGSHVN